MTVVLAILLALGVPFAQLSMVDDRVSCCCPSPEVCKCPDHDEDSGQSTMKSCHKQAPELVRAQLASVVPPAEVMLVAPARRALAVTHVITSPHPAPVPRRLDAPS